MEPVPEPDCPPAEIPDGALARELPIVNRKGLHARASAKFVQTVDRYESDVTVTRTGSGYTQLLMTADAKRSAAARSWAS